MKRVLSFPYFTALFAPLGSERRLSTLPSFVSLFVSASSTLLLNRARPLSHWLMAMFCFVLDGGDDRQSLLESSPASPFRLCARGDSSTSS